MSISFKHQDVVHTFHEGDPVLVRVVCGGGRRERIFGRKSVKPFIGEVQEKATAGQYFYVRGQGRRQAVPWDGFSLLEGFGKKADD